MKTHIRGAGFALTFLLLAALPIGQARSQDTWRPQEAAQYLDGRAQWWFDWPSAARGQGTTCISCHTTLPYALARPALSAKLGETAAGALEKTLIDRVQKRVASWDKIVADSKDKDPFRPFYGAQRKPSALGTEAVLNALVLVNHDFRRVKGTMSEPAQQALGQLWEQQQADGAWLWLDFGLRPWETTDATYVGASFAALAVGLAGKDYYERDDIKPKVAALKKHLTTQLPKQRLHHRMMALWASSRLPGFLDGQAKTALVSEILNAQQTDGGWSLAKLGAHQGQKDEWKTHGFTRPGASSDGYATGLAVLALKSSGAAADNPKLKKALGWLNTRQKDGTWPATYLNRTRDPETDTGKFMRDAATAFAVLALSD